MNEVQSEKPIEASQTQGSAPQTDSQNEKDLDLVKTLLSSYDPSHIHKENIAYAAFTLQVAIFASVILAEQWPPCWLAHYCHGIVVLIIVIIWLPIHMFVGWQLMNRRSHAKVINAATDYLWGSIGESGENNRANTDKPDESLMRLIWAMVWWMSSYIRTDVKIKRPVKLESLIKRQPRPKTWPEEFILWFFSVAMFVLILFRTCND